MNLLQKHSEQPNFIVYRDSKRIEECDGLVRSLIHYGANPMYSCNPPPPQSEIKLMKGLVKLYGGDDLIFCRDYVEGDILCIQNYPSTISDFDLNVNKTHSYWLYGLSNRLSCYRLGQKEFFKKQMIQSFQKINVKRIPIFPPTGPQKSEESPMILD
jgi:hypothetical protein